MHYIEESGIIGDWSESKEDCAWFNVITKEASLFYEVFTDSEAKVRASQYIRENIWTFCSEFVSDYTRLTQKAISKIQELGHDGVEDLLEIIGDRFENLVDDSISYDGYGHFLNGCNGDSIVQDGFIIVLMDEKRRN